jgi:hypothetical protein
MLVPSKVAARISQGLKKFQPIVDAAKSSDVNESDTVLLLTGILSEILGYDKYTDITTELAIRGTYCDLAIKTGGKICFLLEAKAIGMDLKEAHIKQAVDYAANKGIEWVVLSNGVTWKMFKVLFEKPIQNILFMEIDFLKLNHKSNGDIERFFVLSKEAVCKSSFEHFYTQKQATSRFIVGNLILTDGVIVAIRKEIKSIFPEIKVGIDEIINVIKKEVLRREIIEGDESNEAIKKISKATRKREKVKADQQPQQTQPAETHAETQVTEDSKSA